MGAAESPSTCQARAHAPAVDGAVAGTGLAYNLIEAQVFGVGCTTESLPVSEQQPQHNQNTSQSASEHKMWQTRTLVFVGGLGRRGLPGGPVGSDLSASQPLASHLLDGILCILPHTHDDNRSCWNNRVPTVRSRRRCTRRFRRQQLTHLLKKDTKP